MFEEVVDALIGITDSSLDDELRRLELEHRRRDSELIAAVLVAESRGLHARDGHRSMNGYLRATFNWSTAEAGRWIAQARAVGAIKGLGEALAEGRVGTPQVALFAKAHSNRRVRDALDRLAPTLLRHAEELSCSDFDAVMSHAWHSPTRTAQSRTNAMQSAVARQR